MKKTLLKKALFKVKGNNLLSFLFFLLVSCSLWLSLTLNGVYETKISVSVQVRNIPDDIRLENGGDITIDAIVRGSGTALFGYIFDNEVAVSVNYSDFTREGGRLSAPSAIIRRKVQAHLDQTVSLVGLSGDSLVANVQRATAMLPVYKDLSALETSDNCELVSVRCVPDSVSVAAWVDILPRIKEVRVEPFAISQLANDTVIVMDILPGEYIDVQPASVELHVDVAIYQERVISVPVEYVEFPSDVSLETLPKDVNLIYEALDINFEKISVLDFSVKLTYEDYLRCVALGDVVDISGALKVENLSPYVRKVTVYPSGGFGLLPRYAFYRSVLW